MKSLLTTLLSLALAGAAAFGVARFLRHERAEASPDLPGPAAAVGTASPVDAAPGAPGGSRTVLEEAEPAPPEANGAEIAEDGSSVIGKHRSGSMPAHTVYKFNLPMGMPIPSAPRSPRPKMRSPSVTTMMRTSCAGQFANTR